MKNSLRVMKDERSNNEKKSADAVQGGSNLTVIIYNIERLGRRNCSTYTGIRIRLELNEDAVTVEKFTAYYRL